MNDIIAKDQCFSLKDMALGGNDLLRMGVPEGPRIGETLSILLDEVISGSLPNDRDALAARARELL